MEGLYGFGGKSVKWQQTLQGNDCKLHVSNCFSRQWTVLHRCEGLTKSSETLKDNSQRAVVNQGIRMTVDVLPASLEESCSKKRRRRAVQVQGRAAQAGTTLHPPPWVASTGMKYLCKIKPRKQCRKKCFFSSCCSFHYSFYSFFHFSLILISFHSPLNPHRVLQRVFLLPSSF